MKLHSNWKRDLPDTEAQLDTELLHPREGRTQGKTNMEPITTLFLTVFPAVVFTYVVWFLLFADCDLSLTLKEMFGRSVSVYKGKVVWVTGATSGLGEAMAYELASVGARLVLSARNKKRLEEVKNKCLDISKGKLDKEDILVLPFDVTNCGIHKEKCATALDHFNEVDVLINNAGRIQTGACEKTSIDVDMELFHINYFGPVNLTKVVLKHFQERRNGQIVCITSTSAKFASPGIASYCATKHALWLFYEALRMECNPDNIKVTLVCPGYFESNIGNNAMFESKGEINSNLVNCEIQMPTSRCAHLSLVAAANHSYEAWISYQPNLLSMFMSQYFPTIFTICSLKTYTKEIVADCVQGIYPKAIKAWKPLLSRS